MKKSFTPHEWNALFRQATSLISRYVLLFFCLLIVLPHFSFGQQFVKTYNSSLSCNGPAGNLMFGCITKSKKAGRYFIAGTQDTSIYVCEVDAMGTVLQEKLLDVKNATTVLRSMITDDDGNIVMVGTTYTGGYSTFLLKLSPAFSILIHRTYNLDATGKTSTYFTDVKDHKFSTTYYISGAILSGNTFDYTVGDAMLLQVDRNTGNIVNRITGNAGQVDSYDALVFPPKSSTVMPKVIATGTFSPTATNTFRPRINIHNNNLTFLNGKRYLQDHQFPGRLYSFNLVNDGDSILNCWNGDISSKLDVGKNAGVSKYNATTLTPKWQKEYTFSPAPQLRRYLSKVDSTLNGYVVGGSWWDNTTRINNGSVGEMILLHITKNGAPVWSRKIKDVMVNTGNHNSSFVVDGKYIFSVGFKKATTAAQKTTGVLVKIPLLNGALDTTCSTVQIVTVRDYTFSTTDVITNNDIKLKDTVIYYPVNCTKTDTITTCNTCNPLVQLPSADFDLTGTIHSGNTSTYEITATNFNTTANSRWTVSEVIVSFDFAPYASPANGIWGTATSTQFGGWAGLNTVSESIGIGTFFQNHKYRFRHILSQTTNCGITKNDTVVKVILMCPNCKPVNGSSIVTTEKPGSQSEPVTNEDKQSLRMLPNPVTGSSFTLENFSTTKSVVTVKIIDMYGRQVANKTFTSKSGINLYNMDARQLGNGAYTAIILSEEKTLTQKFVVSKK